MLFSKRGCDPAGGRNPLLPIRESTEKTKFLAKRHHNHQSSGLNLVALKNSVFRPFCSIVTRYSGFLSTMRRRTMQVARKVSGRYDGMYKQSDLFNCSLTIGVLMELKLRQIR